MYSNLRKGDSGQPVRELQALLRGLGQSVKVDGDFGPITDKKVRDIQKAMNIPIDGIVGPRTWNLLHGRPANGNRPGGVDRFDPKAKTIAAPGGGGGGGDATPEPTKKIGGKTPAKPGSSPSRGTRRVSFSGFSGKGYVVADYASYEGYEVRLIGERIVRRHNPAAPIKNECAQFVQLFGVPNTRRWRAGPQVCHMKPGDLMPGTVVATLRDGVYHSDYSGRSHVGLYLGHDDYEAYEAGDLPGAGLTLLDQWNGAPIAKRTKRYDVEGNKQGRKSKKSWIDAKGSVQTKRINWSGDGEEYFVLLTED